MTIVSIRPWSKQGNSPRLQKSEERAMDFHINLGQNRPNGRNKEKTTHHKIPKTQRNIF